MHDFTPIASGMPAALVFVPSMAAGMVFCRLWEGSMRTAPRDESSPPAWEV